MDAQRLLREINLLKKENEELLVENISLIRSVEFLIDSLMWASASSDFAEDGIAREGWERIRPILAQELEKIEKLKDNRKYWNIK